MRTNIDLNDKLIEQAMRYTDASTKKAVVDEALEMFVKIKGQTDIRALRGKIHWEGRDEHADNRVPDEAWGR